jgi:hypothetical protein
MGERHESSEVIKSLETESLKTFDALRTVVEKTVVDVESVEVDLGEPYEFESAMMDLGEALRTVDSWEIPVERPFPGVVGNLTRIGVEGGIVGSSSTVQGRTSAMAGSLSADMAAGLMERVDADGTSTGLLWAGGKGG